MKNSNGLRRCFKRTFDTKPTVESKASRRRERGGRLALDHLTMKYFTTVYSGRNRRARATDITRGYSLRRDETPIIRAGIRVKIIEGERTRRARERMRHGG